MNESTAMYGMSNFIGLYLFILGLILVEYFIRRKMKLGSLRTTPASSIGYAAMGIRSLALVGAIPLLHPMTIFYLLVVISFQFPIGGDVTFAVKWGLFLLWIGLVLCKAYLERKHLNTKSAVLTLAFGVPIIGLLYSIYTYTF